MLLPERSDPIREFFGRPYEARVSEIKHLYRHEVKKGQLGEWFNWDAERLDNEVARNFRLYFHLLLGYSRILRPRSVLQLGSFTMTDSQWLIADKFPGRIVASDYSAEHVEYLRKGFAGGLFDRVEFRVVDIEEPKDSDLHDVTMVVALAVFSNIQPEGMERFFAALARSPVECVLIGDMYVKPTLTLETEGARSVPMPNSRNWNHPYLSLGRRHGFDSFFLPDFTYSSFVEARGVFVIHRQVPREAHLRAIAEGFGSYLARQDGFLRRYVAEAYPELDCGARNA